MATKMNVMSPPKAKYDPAEEKLDCWRVWARPKNARKEARKRSHMMLGSYLFDARK